MKQTIKQLEKKALSVRKELNDINDQISSLKDQKELPALKKKYEGKFFKYMNSAGGDYGKWPIYVFCKEVVSRNEVRVNSFESAPINGNQNEFKIDHNVSTWMMETEITGNEYHTALVYFESKMLQLMSDYINIGFPGHKP